MLLAHGALEEFSHSLGPLLPFNRRSELSMDAASNKSQPVSSSLDDRPPLWCGKPDFRFAWWGRPARDIATSQELPPEVGCFRRALCSKCQVERHYY